MRRVQGVMEQVAARAGTALGGLLLSLAPACGEPQTSGPDAALEQAAPAQAEERLELASIQVPELALTELGQVPGAFAMAADWQGQFVVLRRTPAGDEVVRQDGAKIPLARGLQGLDLVALEQGVGVLTAGQFGTWDPVTDDWTWSPAAREASHLTHTFEGRILTQGAGGWEEIGPRDEGRRARRLPEQLLGGMLLTDPSGLAHCVTVGSGQGSPTEDDTNWRVESWPLGLPGAPDLPRAEGLRALRMEASGSEDPLRSLEGALVVVEVGAPGLRALLPARSGAGRTWTAVPLLTGGSPLLDLDQGPDGDVRLLTSSGHVLSLHHRAAEPLPPLAPFDAGPSPDPLAPALDALSASGLAARRAALARLHEAGGLGAQALRSFTAHPRPEIAARALPALVDSGAAGRDLTAQLLHRAEPLLRQAALSALLPEGLSVEAVLLGVRDTDAGVRVRAALGVPALGWPGPGTLALSALLQRWDPEDPIESAALVAAAGAALAEENWWQDLEGVPEEQVRLLRERLP